MIEFYNKNCKIILKKKMHFMYNIIALNNNNEIFASL